MFENTNITRTYLTNFFIKHFETSFPTIRASFPNAHGCSWLFGECPIIFIERWLAFQAASHAHAAHSHALQNLAHKNPGVKCAIECCCGTYHIILTQDR